MSRSLLGRRAALLVAVLGALALVVVWGQAVASQRAPSLRVLFLGNSLTAANDLPEMVVALGRARGVSIEYGAFTPGGYSLEDHWVDQGRELLAAGDWDAVVMQQGPSALPESQVLLRQWATRWADEARTYGTTPALYTVWPEAYRSYALPTVVESYRDAARASRSLLLPAGDAWREAWRRNRKLRLYGDDGFHPSTTGTYLASLVIYAGLTKTSPVGLPRTLQTPRFKVTISPKASRTLQQAARIALARR